MQDGKHRAGRFRAGQSQLLDSHFLGVLGLLVRASAGVANVKSYAKTHECGFRICIVLYYVINLSWQG